MYPNIDVRYFSEKGILKYDLIVKPGGRVTDIALKYDGIDELRIKNKDLIIPTTVGNLKELAPYTYQYDENGKTEVRAKYTLKHNVVRFNIKNYDPTTTLIIDPNLIFCSYAGSAVENWGFTATYGPDGSMYGGGIAFGQGFPTSKGAFQTNYGSGTSNNGAFLNGFDIALIKLTPNGSSRVYGTYLGGSGNEFPQSLIVDPQGELIVAGRSNSVDYPTTGSNFGPLGGFDITLTKFNAAGTSLIGSKRIGGSNDDGANITEYGVPASKSLLRNYGDEARSEVNLDAAGNIYLASCTQSTNFPIVGGFQSNSGGQQDGVVLKLSSDLSQIYFSSYLGGSGNDAAYVISLSPINNNIYVAGGTESPNLPGTGPGTIGPNFLGTIDGFVSIISNDGAALIKTSYFTTGAIDQIYGLQFDLMGYPYIMGQTTGNWPIINALWNQPKGKQFIAKLQPDLSSYVYSTAFGSGASTPNISPVAFLVDKCENVYVSGWGGKIGDANFQSAGTRGLPVTPNAIKKTTDVNPQNGLGEDFYFFVLKKDATAQLFGSFFGQNGPLADHVDGGTSRFDKNGVIYEAICANCGGRARFPTTPGAWATTKPANVNCNLAMVKIAFNLSGVRGGILSFAKGHWRDTSGCVPFAVQFADTVQIAKSYSWDFGDGSPSVNTTLPTIGHIFNSIGLYRVRLIAIDSTSCNIYDTSYLNIKVGNLKALLDFKATKLPPCTAFQYKFDNTSQSPPTAPFGPQDFEWDFGDGTPTLVSGLGTVLHNFAAPGVYNTKLILRNNIYCNYPDTIYKQLRVASLVKARIETPATGCAPYNAEFLNTSDAGSEFHWDFGDGSTSTDVSPTHLYAFAGTYTISLLAIDPNTCNGRDSTKFTITVYNKPVSNFTAAPQPPSENTPISFSNLASADAIHFEWQFGDDDSLITDTREIIQHEYTATDTYQVCLVAINAAGCRDTFCSPVRTFIVPAVDVPNAFTPNGNGANRVVYVRGFGFARMKFIVWARWGEKVFETQDKRIGWDGRFKGQLLPMDVYAYTLEVEFTDGTRTTKTGDITLIR
ncbi:MAG: hypothetical protein NVS9B7_12250 [Flavisolibacter sp.]